MRKLSLYSIFHLNLMYSSIRLKDKPKVIEKCYWPLLKLAASLETPLGIELTGKTLELIKKIDPDWIVKLRQLLKEEKVELIGSGYTQIIGPLVPAKVNDWNQKLGLGTYKKILGIRPQIALVNEMAYSTGIIEHYLNNGYKAIIMEWNNPYRFHPEWSKEWQYFPQIATNSNGISIPIIWNNSIVFQKFQRYAQGEIELGEYMSYLRTHSNESVRFLPLYGNDVEIFDYRPGRYDTEVDIGEDGEWNRIVKLFKELSLDLTFEIIAPSRVMDLAQGENAFNNIKLESPEDPIPVKKQEKYNINRWALTGRDDLGINTKCYCIYKFLEETKNENPEGWKELCYLWSSDFRTHITEDRWTKYRNRLNSFLESKVKKNTSSTKEDKRITKTPCDNNLFQCFEDKRYLTIETDSIKCIFDKSKGLAIYSFWIKNKSKEPLFGTLPHGYYDDISFGADFYSGHAIIEKAGQHKFTNLSKANHFISYDSKSIIISCENIDRDVRFNKKYKVYSNECCIEIFYEIIIPKRDVATIHPLNITFIPTSFDKDTLFYATHNGGREIEKFEIKDNIINHAQNLSSLISAKHGLGATKGIVVIGDDRKQISFWHDQTMSALIPSIHYLPMNNNQYFLRLQYSAQEIDETFIKNREVQKLECCWKINLRQDE